MKTLAAEGRGYIALPAVSLADAVSCYNYQVVGRADNCCIRFYAITGKRMIEHPAVRQMTKDVSVFFTADALNPTLSRPQCALAWVWLMP